jgi:hypothetical protein
MSTHEDDLAQMRHWTADEIEKVLAALANPQKQPRLAKPRRPKKDR